MKILFTAFFICASCILMMGCTTVMGDLPAISAGLTGCPPDTIAIHDEKVGYYNDTWTANCQGRTFYCTRQVRGNTTCTEAMINIK
jgi:O-acetyl-ADP-ribose deacetylase (regulator of RNase III)